MLCVALVYIVIQILPREILYVVICFNNISVISRWSVLSVEETKLPQASN
jgi:hypothetical protein